MSDQPCNCNDMMERRRWANKRIDQLEGALRAVRNNLGAYRYYEDSQYLEDADNVAKIALENSNGG